MPNHCENELKVKGPQDELERFKLFAKGIYPFGDLVFPKESYMDMRDEEAKRNMSMAHQLTWRYKLEVVWPPTIKCYVRRLNHELQEKMDLVLHAIGKTGHILLWDDMFMTGFSTIWVTKVLEEFGISRDRIHTVALICEKNLGPFN